MIPIKLTMRNFMCYRNAPPLSFEGIHTACISGDNGNGKSALIDAMTWALWGKTRAKTDDDLIFQGEHEAEVEFDFRVGEQFYRIIRKRSRPKRSGGAGQSTLEFQMANNGGFVPITGDAISKTETRIIGVLHMDYDTFINSAYLRQGHSGEFTEQPAAKRKDVLANILQLSVYDELEDKAKESARASEAQQSQLNSAIQTIDAELGQKPAYESELALVSTELLQIEQTVKEQETRLNKLRAEKELLDQKQAQLSQITDYIKGREKDLERWQAQADQHSVRLKEYQLVISQREAIEKGFAQLTDSRKSCDELNQKLALLLKLNERKNKLEKVIESAKAGLVTQRTLIQSRVTELETKSQKLAGYQDELKQLERVATAIADYEKSLQQKKGNVQTVQSQVTYLEADKARLEREIKETGEKLDLLLGKHDAKCPLCEQELGPEEHKRIQENYVSERQAKTVSLKSTVAQIVSKKQEVQTAVAETTQMEAKLVQNQGLFVRKEALVKKNIADVEESAGQLAQEKVKLADVERTLMGGGFAVVEQEDLRTLEVELAGLAYDGEHHEQLRKQLNELAKYETPKRRLEEADRSIAQEQEAVTRANEVIAQLRDSLKAELVKKEALAAELASLGQSDAGFKQAEQEYLLTVTRQKLAQQKLGSVNEKLARCVELEARKKDKRKQLNEAAKETDIYNELALAFGKKGIQAWLIERVVPEIELEADKLLSKMTDGRMHIRFETQRATKKGDTVETLEINIADELGTRKYEMFSGGEAFRINFAVRIALSKLLARRAGAPLPTLIIDEGFGTQDSTAIEKVKEAINSIQDDFEKILVITHMEELKDAFPARINVVKTAEGSTVSVS